MKIGIDARMYGNEECTGIGTYIKNMTNELFKIDQENEYIMFLREPAYSNYTPATERVKKALVTPRWYTYAEQIKLPLELSKEKLDLIHYPHFNSPILYAKKSVCTIHDMTPFTFPGHKMSSKWRQFAHKLVFWVTCLKARQIIAVSESTKQAITEKFNFNPNKIKVTYEGVDDRFQMTENNGIISDVKSKFGITQPYIFFVGVWRNHKNIENLIKAYNLLKKQSDLPHQLVLGGREDLHYTEVRKEIEKSEFRKDIITTGFIEDNDLPSLYQGADLFVIPSFIEGFGLIAIEAQNCGCPVVSSNTTSLPEVLADSALYFDPNKVEGMAKVITKVLQNKNLQQELKTKGKENIKRFSWRKCAEQTLEIYKEA
jgi:glycosyltransferase involved in cell wall biosynthesis